MWRNDWQGNHICDFVMATGRVNTVGRMLSLCSHPHLTSLTYLGGRLVNLTECEMIGWTGFVGRSIRYCLRSCDSRTYISESHSVSLMRFRQFATHFEVLKTMVVSIVSEDLCIEPCNKHYSTMKGHMNDFAKHRHRVLCVACFLVLGIVPPLGWLIIVGGRIPRQEYR